MDFDPVVLTYLANTFSVGAAYCLSKGGTRLMTGRFLGICAALTWLTYGVITVNISFLIAEFIFLYIYGQAVFKFYVKKESYNKKIKASGRLIDRYKRKLKNKK